MDLNIGKVIDIFYCENIYINSSYWSPGGTFVIVHIWFLNGFYELFYLTNNMKIPKGNRHNLIDLMIAQHYSGNGLT